MAAIGFTPETPKTEGSRPEFPAHLSNLVVNALLGRQAFYKQLLDGRYGTRNIDQECGYPTKIQISDYVTMYERGDIASRVVDLEPNECWKEYPEVYETEENRETPFEVAVDKLLSTTRLFSYLHRLDRISGVGRFGLLFIGLDDGKDFDKPAPGFTQNGVADSPGTAKVLYYRVFDESAVHIAEYEDDPRNPRYGLPTLYNLQFETPATETAGTGSELLATTTMTVHWSRIIHVADNLTTSEIFGSPRMQNVYNRLMDLRKVNAGASEMFWKGGFPGYAFEVDPRNGELDETDRELIKDEIKKWEEGLTRYFAGVGVAVKSLEPQISSPQPFVDNILRIIATTKGIPIRLFIGTESASVASTQDAETWTERVALRREMYVSPYIIRPTIDRMMQYGALPSVQLQDGKSVGYTIKWRPLAEMTLTEKAEVGLKRTEALARYATSGGEALVPLEEWLTKIMLLPFQEAQAIATAPVSERSLVFKELAAMSGSTGGNVPSSVPKTQKPTQKKDPSKTPTNTVQRKKRATPSNPGSTQ